jgi:protein-S-isoprenylcysteine O-methyltransferase Ste14
MILAVGVVVFQLRETLLRARFGPQPVLMAVAVVVYVLAIGVALQRRKGLAVAQLVGLPELAPHRADSRLSTSGIYSRVRHPRYLELLLFLLGHALLTNYLAVYVALGVCLAGFPVIVYFEEKELRERFGRQHELYCARVPRFIPGF